MYWTCLWLSFCAGLLLILLIFYMYMLFYCNLLYNVMQVQLKDDCPLPTVDIL